nr:hypothetical protein BaRGS_007707 [Batillaria attramentaria]
MTSITPVSLLWSLLSILVASACGLSFFHPYWIVHPDRLHSFGLFTQCVRDTKAHYPRAVCKGYGPGDGAWDGVDLGSIPAGAWQASTLLIVMKVFVSGVGEDACDSREPCVLD